MMKYLTLDNITTLTLIVGIVLAIWLLVKTVKKYNKAKAEKDAKNTSQQQDDETYRYITTLSEIAALQAERGELAGNLSGETAVRNQGVFSRDEADRYVRKGVLGSSGFETSGDSAMLNPLAFTAYGSKSGSVGAL